MQTSILPALAVSLWAGLFSLTVLNAHAGEVDCGSLQNHYGPFDYTNADHYKNKLPIVERHHFDGNVEMLIRGKSAYICTDLDYVLRVFPNHHRALSSMALYQLKNPISPNCPKLLPADCYFDRAKRLNSADAEVYVIYGWYLHMRGQPKEALAEYRQAEKIKTRSSADRDYKIGLALFDLKQYDESKVYAERARKRGYPDDELLDKLKSVGF